MYNVRTKYVHTQSYFDGPVVLNRDNNHVNMVRFITVSWCDRQKHNPRREVGFGRDARDLVDEIAAESNIYSLCLYFEEPP